MGCLGRNVKTFELIAFDETVSTFTIFNLVFWNLVSIIYLVASALPTFKQCVFVGSSLKVATFKLLSDIACVSTFKLLPIWFVDSDNLKFAFLKLLSHLITLGPPSHAASFYMLYWYHHCHWSNFWQKFIIISFFIFVGIIIIFIHKFVILLYKTTIISTSNPP